MENLQPEIKDIAKRLNQEVAVCARQFGWSKRVARYAAHTHIHTYMYGVNTGLGYSFDWLILITMQCVLCIGMESS